MRPRITTEVIDTNSVTLRVSAYLDPPPTRTELAEYMANQDRIEALRTAFEELMRPHLTPPIPNLPIYVSTAPTPSPRLLKPCNPALAYPEWLTTDEQDTRP